MKSLKYFLPLLLFFLAFSACKKEEYKNTVSGRVLELGTDKPIENALARFYDCKYYTGTSGFGGTDCTLTDSMRTGADGSFSFELPPAEGNIPFVKVTADNYWDAMEWYPSSSSDSYEIGRLEPVSWLHLRVKNVEPVEQSDNFEYWGPWTLSFPVDNFPGSDVEFSIIHEMKGNREWEILYSIRKNGVTTDYSELIDYSAHDTVFYEILY